MTEHALAIRTGLIIGFGTSYCATCVCGWEGRFQMYKFAAESDYYDHRELYDNALDAESWGAV